MTTRKKTKERRRAGVAAARFDYDERRMTLPQMLKVPMPGAHKVWARAYRAEAERLWAAAYQRARAERSIYEHEATQ